MRLHLHLNGLPDRGGATSATFADLAEHAVENMVDVPELFVEIERALDLGRRQHVRHVRVREQQLS